MSELNQAIETWRNAQDPRVVTGELQSELEDHLHVEVSKLMGIGLPADDAVLLAAKRIGHPLPVSAELLKTDPHRIWRQRVIWMCGGYLLFMLATHLIYIATDAVGTIAYHLNLGLPSLRILMLTTFWAGYAVLILAPAWIARGRINLNRFFHLAVHPAQCLARVGKRRGSLGLGHRCLTGRRVLLLAITSTRRLPDGSMDPVRRRVSRRQLRHARPAKRDVRLNRVVMSMQMAYWNAGLLLPAGLCMVVWSLHIRRSTARPR